MLLGAAVSVIVMLMSAFLLETTLDRHINESLPLLTRLQEIPVFQKWLEGLDLVNVPEIIMYMNLVHAELSVSGLSDLLSGGMGMSLKWIPLLLFPLLSLVPGGYLAARRHGLSSAWGILPVSLGIGAAYGLFLVAVSSFAGFHHQVNTPVLFTSLKGSVDYSFSIGEAFFHGMLFGTLFSWLGQELWARKKRRNVPALGTFRPVKAALQATGWGWAAASVLMLAVWMANAGEEQSLRTGIQLMPQLGGYAWGVANLGELSLVRGSDQTTASVWTGITAVTGEANPWLSGAVYPVVARLAIVIALAVLLWSGRRLAAHPGSRAGRLGLALQFSVVYALSLSFLAFVSKVELAFHGGALSRFEANGRALEAGLEVLPVFFSSLALALTVLGGCSFLFKGRRGRQA
jgi:hypothetical protein